MTNKMYDQVMEFHKVFDAYISEKPELRDKKIAKLRVNLFDEELNEFKEAVYTS
jgi:predicted HAD superfamily Cof-like phosphohydrolase